MALIDFNASRETIVLAMQATMIVVALVIVAWVFYHHCRGIKRLEDRMRAEPLHKPVTHHVKLDGVMAFVLKAEADTGKIVLSGWNMTARNKWREKDYLVIFLGDEGRTTRYRIDSLRLMRDPPDQYFADCTFAPRGVVANIREQA